MYRYLWNLIVFGDFPHFNLSILIWGNTRNLWRAILIFCELNKIIRKVFSSIWGRLTFLPAFGSTVFFTDAWQLRAVYHFDLGKSLLCTISIYIFSSSLNIGLTERYGFFFTSRSMLELNFLKPGTLWPSFHPFVSHFNDPWIV